MDLDEGTAWIRAKLERSWNKLCSEGKEIIQDKYEAAKKIVQHWTKSNNENRHLHLLCLQVPPDYAPEAIRAIAVFEGKLRADF